MFTKYIGSLFNHSFSKKNAVPHKIENVIWQTTAGLYTEFELQYIQCYLLKDIEYNAFFDYNACSAILDNSLIVFSNDSPKLTPELEEYFKKFDKLNYNYSLLHLSNERLSYKHDFKYYKRAKHVLRGYYDPRIKLKNVLTIPIGFKSGLLNTENITPTIFEREYRWAFIGQLKKDRKEMHDALISSQPNYVYLTSKWDAPEQLTVEKIIEIYKKTIFIPCPMGFCNPDTFRLNEALEWGCIPIVKKFNSTDYFVNVYGKHPFIVVDKWADATTIIENMCRDTEALENYRQSIIKWYAAFKFELQNKIKIIFAGD